MTNNQINYAVHKENQRHNLVTEGETGRHNLAQEVETNRSNVARETETRRNNIASLNELNRHNQATEAQGWYNAYTQRAYTQGTLAETHRSNVAREALTEYANITSRQQAAETARHNFVSEVYERQQANAAQQNAASNAMSANAKLIDSIWRNVNGSVNAVANLF
mgnify:CR=1 FL=1